MAKRHKDDIAITDPVETRADAYPACNDAAAQLRATGQTDRFGVYVEKNGRGFSVFLHDRQRDSFDVSDQS